MIRYIVSLSQEICMIGGGDARSAIKLGLSQGNSQQCYYYFLNGITETVGTRLEIVLEMPLQSSPRGWKILAI